jgi:hypothetical protein
MIRDYRCIIAVWKSCLELSGLNAGFAEYIDIYILLLHVFRNCNVQMLSLAFNPHVFFNISSVRGPDWPH